MLRILNIVGARPNFMKIAPLIKAMRASGQIEPVLVHTGQHYDENLSRVFFEDLGIPEPDRNLGVGSGSRDEQIEAIRAAFAPVVDEQRPDAVLVVGDVNSTIACAGIAREKGVPVVHVEAGLRSFDPAMPEELNRVQTDRISDFLFVTEASGMINLESEGVTGKRFLVGNVMIDTLVTHLAAAREGAGAKRLGLTPGGYMIATFHRPSNVDSRPALERVVEALRETCRHTPLLLPLHPRTRESLRRHDLAGTLAGIEGLHLSDPLGYIEFIGLVASSRGVLTDSGGMQEETTFLGIPCITMRSNTERPVTVDTGTNVLVGDDVARAVELVGRIVAGTFKRGRVPPMWDGHAAERIVSILVAELAAGHRPPH